jgi:hypothetical protein
LLVAFASECLERMKEGGIREHIEKLINGRILQMATVPAEAVRACAPGTGDGSPSGSRRKLEEIA